MELMYDDAGAYKLQSNTLFDSLLPYILQYNIVNKPPTPSARRPP